MPRKRHPQTRMTVKTVYFWSHSWRQWEWDRKRKKPYRVLSNQLTMKWVAFILQGCFNISLHAPLGGPAQEEVQVCVICTHQISPIRVGVTYRTLRSCRGCKVTFNSCRGGGGSKRIQMLTAHWNTAGIVWKSEDEVVHLELFLSIFIDSTHGKQRRERKALTAGAITLQQLGLCSGPGSSGSAHQAASCQLRYLLRWFHVLVEPLGKVNR